METNPQQIKEQYERGNVDIIFRCDLKTILDSNGNTPLHLIAKKNDVDSLIKLHQMKQISPSILNRQNTIDGETPLHIAVKNSKLTGDYSMPQLMVDMGANENIVNFKGERVFLEKTINQSDTFKNDDDFLKAVVSIYGPKIDQYHQQKQRGGKGKKKQKKEPVSEEEVFSTEEGDYSQLYQYRKNTINDLDRIIELNRRSNKEISKLHSIVISRIKKLMKNMSDADLELLKRYLSWKISQENKDLTPVERAKKLVEMVESKSDKELTSILKEVDIEVLRQHQEERRKQKQEERESRMTSTESSEEKPKAKAKAKSEVEKPKKKTKKQEGGYEYDRITKFLESEDY